MAYLDQTLRKQVNNSHAREATPLPFPLLDRAEKAGNDKQREELYRHTAHRRERHRLQFWAAACS
jgi:hypothetical protein